MISTIVLIFHCIPFLVYFTIILTPFILYVLNLPSSIRCGQDKDAKASDSSREGAQGTLELFFLIPVYTSLTVKGIILHK